MLHLDQKTYSTRTAVNDDHRECRIGIGFLILPYRASVNQPALFLEVLDDLLVGVFDVESFKVSDAVCEPSRSIKGAHNLHS